METKNVPSKYSHCSMSATLEILCFVRVQEEVHKVVIIQHPQIFFLTVKWKFAQCLVSNQILSAILETGLY